MYQILTSFIALVWLVNGLFLKILNYEPRHQQIVSRILGEEYSEFFTMIIGVSEITMAIWIISNSFQKVNAIFQIVIIITMNILEFILAPDLLLWGKLNVLFAMLFSLLIYYNTFILKSAINKISIT